MNLWARSESSASRARNYFASVTCDPAEAARGADLCVFCTPVGAMPSLAETVVRHLPDNAVVTDAGSVKGGIVPRLEGVFGGRFVGSHPMAGAEKSGVEAARENLFEQAVSIVTPTSRSLPEALRAVRSLWEAVGCRVVEMAPEVHDEAVARISHLPHAVAAALVDAIGRKLPESAALAGGGYRDTTRIAAGPPAMWAEILLENKTALLAALADFTCSVEELARALRADDRPALEAFLTRARDIRSSQP